MSTTTAIPPELLLAASAVYGVSVNAILGRGRDRASVLARQSVIWTLRAESDLTLTEIGELMGDRDHTTILAAARSIEAKAVKNARIALSLAALRREVAS